MVVTGSGTKVAKFGVLFMTPSRVAGGARPGRSVAGEVGSNVGVIMSVSFEVVKARIRPLVKKTTNRASTKIKIKGKRF